MRNAYKVFGRRAERGVEKLKSGTPREELREEGLTAAVIDATFDVPESEIFVVMGLSGSGKSTLIRMVNGLLDPTAGSVTVGGVDISRFNDRELRSIRREKISMVFQHFALLPHRTVGQNAGYGLEVRGVNRSDREAKAAEALKMVGLDGWGGYRPDELSGGMRQRVGLARALAAGTDVMLMDEAFSALDPLIRREMQDQLIELQQHLGKTILFITHDLNEAMRLGDRIAMMRDGRIVQVGTSKQILNEPANDYVAQFIQDVDRARVLTADSIMESASEALQLDSGLQAAQRAMSQQNVASLVVADSAGTLQGVVHEAEVTARVLSGGQSLKEILHPVHGVRPDSALIDVLPHAAATGASLPVVDDSNALLGLIPQATLFRALADPTTSSHASAGDQQEVVA
ncbi:MAG TPA: glycine betaine/L-proline ABC transporter ATP-binding protein [Candidatus Nesterenkonia stercoripullorum]|uniref:Glycine betaine/L-proline ABC transporter ATP-binding protein n=1 Tax=Candidatus Nesterenkonia stercoripullorum TaxID=2838701 RepID=A0A9D1S1P5_9MICC|nr:glycine betaine/L-proline ABC transporter ATP-binding protein [Candidatus Nesterenkonia stercoripullorum]